MKGVNNMKIKGIRKAVGDFNNWQGAARIYFDKSTGEVWANVYTAPCWWTEYHDVNIVEVYSKATYSMWERDNTITMKRLKQICLNEYTNTFKTVPVM